MVGYFFDCEGICAEVATGVGPLIGQAVYVYGPPRAQLDNRPGHIQIFLNGLVMTTIDLEAKYGETDDDLWGPRLIYHWQGGGIDASHILQISLLDSGSPIRGFGIDSVVYTSLEPRRPYVLSHSPCSHR